jgi:hypothetical protein
MYDWDFLWHIDISKCDKPLRGIEYKSNVYLAESIFNGHVLFTSKNKVKWSGSFATDCYLNCTNLKELLRQNDKYDAIYFRNRYTDVYIKDKLLKLSDGNFSKIDKVLCDTDILKDYNMSLYFKKTR